MCGKTKIPERGRRDLWETCRWPSARPRCRPAQRSRYLRTRSQLFIFMLVVPAQAQPVIHLRSRYLCTRSQLFIFMFVVPEQAQPIIHEHLRSRYLPTRSQLFIFMLVVPAQAQPIIHLRSRYLRTLSQYTLLFVYYAKGNNSQLRPKEAVLWILNNLFRTRIRFLRVPDSDPDPAP